MEHVREGIMEFTRVTDTLLGRDSRLPLTQEEKGLLEAYVTRLLEELKLSVIAPSLIWDGSQPDRRRRECKARSQAEPDQHKEAM